MGSSLSDLDNESWLIEAGDMVINKKAELGAAALSPVERLIYCLWVADYGMRNAGDLKAAKELYPNFLHDGKASAQSIGLQHSLTLFSLSASTLLPLSASRFEKRYFELFDEVINELKGQNWT